MVYLMLVRKSSCVQLYVPTFSAQITEQYDAKINSVEQATLHYSAKELISYEEGSFEMR